MICLMRLTIPVDTGWSPHRIQLPADLSLASGSGGSHQSGWISRYDMADVEIYASARKHGIADEDIAHAVSNALAVGDQDDGKALHLGPDRAGNLLEIVSVVRDDGSEIVIHAMPMRAKYEPFLRGERGGDA